MKTSVEVQEMKTRRLRGIDEAYKPSVVCDTELVWERKIRSIGTGIIPASVVSQKIYDRTNMTMAYWMAEPREQTAMVK